MDGPPPFTQKRGPHVASIGASARGLQFGITLPGVGALSVSLSRFADEVSDFTPFWEGEFKTFWYALRKLDYASAGGATGSMWPPLSPAYRVWKNKHFPGRPLLVLHGDLKASVTSPDSPDSVWVAQPKALRVGTTVPYAMSHQRGTSRMPARPPVRLKSEDMAQVGKMLHKFVATAWAQRRKAARNPPAA